MMFLGLTAAAFAQATYRVRSIPVTTVVETGYVEKTGDIEFTTVDVEPTVTGTITIEYGVPITFDQATTAAGVRLTLLPTGIGTLPEVDTFVEGSRLVLTIDPADTGGADFYSIRVEGVRVNIQNDPGAVPLYATITAVGNMIQAGEDKVLVINAKDAGIDSLSGSGSTQIRTTTGMMLSDDDQTLSVREGFRHAYGLTIASDETQNVEQMVKIGLTDQGTNFASDTDFVLPDGISVCFDQYAYSDEGGVWEMADSHGNLIGGGDCLTSVDGAMPAVYYRIISDTDILNVEDMDIDVEVDADFPSDGAYPYVTIYAYASLAPIQEELNPGAIPRYFEDRVGLATIIEFIPSTTTLMVPYSTTEVGYDTGLAIANTTLDPGSSAMHFSGALPQDGAITFYFYPNVGDEFSYSTTSANRPSPVLLDAEGRLARGKSYILLLSSLLAAAGHAGDFSGYIIAVCDFSNAHGQYFISDFEAFTNGAQMLVLDSNWPFGRRLGAEGVNH